MNKTKPTKWVLAALTLALTYSNNIKHACATDGLAFLKKSSDFLNNSDNLVYTAIFFLAALGVLVFFAYNLLEKIIVHIYRHKKLASEIEALTPPTTAVSEVSEPEKQNKSLQNIKLKSLMAYRNMRQKIVFKPTPDTASVQEILKEHKRQKKQIIAQEKEIERLKTQGIARQEELKNQTEKHEAIKEEIIKRETSIQSRLSDKIKQQQDIIIELKALDISRQNEMRHEIEALDAFKAEILKQEASKQEDLKQQLLSKEKATAELISN
ncbi:MAG: hypothetical protein HQM16_06200, partial [Deltaproteobacteria bacterium]|nr:hypothetical protein [Deltaproteobacteria bacterium]